MEPSPDLVRLLVSLPHEVEWVEFKHNNSNTEDIGEYLSALANSAALERKDAGYIVWGVEDGTHHIVGTTFRPRFEKGAGNQELESWLHCLISPDHDFSIHEFHVDELPVVLFKVQPATHAPIRFKGEAYIRVGSYKKKLKEFPPKEGRLWAIFNEAAFERGAARSDVPSDEILTLIDYPAFFSIV